MQDASAVPTVPTSSPPAWASAWVGLPFVARGRDRASGLDCWGIVRDVFAERYGVALPRWDDYDDVRDRRALSEAIDACLGSVVPIVRADAREGDLVVLRLAGVHCHVGLVLADPWFLHARDGALSAIERLDSLTWANRIDGFFRWPR